MATYVGDAVRVTMTSTGLDGTVLTPSLVGSVTCTVFDFSAPPNLILASQPMIYHSVLQYWYLDINTQTGFTPGPYQAKCEIFGIGGTPNFINFEYVTFNLLAPRA
jgi:hypothetical protein